MKVGADAIPQVFRLAHIDDLALGILVQVHPCRGGQSPNFLLQIHDDREKKDDRKKFYLNLPTPESAAASLRLILSSRREWLLARVPPEVEGQSLTGNTLLDVFTCREIQQRAHRKTI